MCLHVRTFIMELFLLPCSYTRRKRWKEREEKKKKTYIRTTLVWLWSRISDSCNTRHVHSNRASCFSRCTSLLHTRAKSCLLSFHLAYVQLSLSLPHLYLYSCLSAKYYTCAFVSWCVCVCVCVCFIKRSNLTRRCNIGATWVNFMSVDENRFEDDSLVNNNDKYLLSGEIDATLIRCYCYIAYFFACAIAIYTTIE